MPIASSFASPHASSVKATCQGSQGVKANFDQATLVALRPAAPRRVFCAREGPAHPLGNVRPCHGPRSVGPRWLSLIFESGRRLYRLRLSSFRGKAWSGRGGDAFYPVRALTLSRRFRFIWNLLARLEMPCARAEKSFRNFTEMRAWHPLTLGGSVT